jgi:hypothetical protein
VCSGAQLTTILLKSLKQQQAEQATMELLSLLQTGVKDVTAFSMTRPTTQPPATTLHSPESQQRPTIPISCVVLPVSIAFRTYPVIETSRRCQHQLPDTTKLPTKSSQRALWCAYSCTRSQTPPKLALHNSQRPTDPLLYNPCDSAACQSFHLRTRGCAAT